MMVPVGNTAQRPANTAGMIRYNTTLNTLEAANGVYWANVGSGSSSTGGVSWQTVQNSSFIAVAMAAATVAAAQWQTMGAFWQRSSVAGSSQAVQNPMESSLHFMNASSAEC
jgi:hypothetical protein